MSNDKRVKNAFALHKYSEFRDHRFLIIIIPILAILIYFKEYQAT